MMEELSTLATGFEVDGGLLRYQVSVSNSFKELLFPSPTHRKIIQSSGDEITRKWTILNSLFH